MENGMCFLVLLQVVCLVPVEPPVQEAELVGKWSIVRFSRGSTDYPETTLSQMCAYFTRKHLLIRAIDTIGESSYTLKKTNGITELDLTAHDGSKKGTTTKGLITLNKEKNKVTIYLGLEGMERPTSIPDKAEEGHELIVMKLIER